MNSEGNPLRLIATVILSKPKARQTNQFLPRSPVPSSRPAVHRWLTHICLPIEITKGKTTTQAHEHIIEINFSFKSKYGSPFNHLLPPLFSLSLCVVFIFASTDIYLI